MVVTHWTVGIDLEIPFINIGKGDIHGSFSSTAKEKFPVAKIAYRTLAGIFLVTSVSDSSKSSYRHGLWYKIWYLI